MVLEIYNKELEEIVTKISKLEVEEAKDDYKSSWWMYGNSWPDKKTCLERKATWKTLKDNIQRKIELIKQTQTNEEEKPNYFSLLNSFSNKLSKVEEKIATLDARLDGELKHREENLKLWNYLAIVILILAFACFLYLIATGKIFSKETGIKSK